MTYLPQVVFVLIVVALAAFALRREILSNPEVVTAGGMFLLLSLVGFLLPAVIALWIGTLVSLPWMGNLSADDVWRAVLVFVISMALFAWGYRLSGRQGLGVQKSGSKKPILRPEIAQAFRTAPLRYKYVYACLLACAAIYVASLWVDMQANGGSWSGFLTAHLLRRWTGEPIPASNAVAWAIQSIGPRMLNVVTILTLILFFYRSREGKPFLWGFVIPMGCWILTVTTFFRGTQLTFFVSMLMVEFLRRRVWSTTSPSAKVPLVSRRTVLIFALAVGAFVAYGSIRELMETNAWGAEEEVASSVVAENAVETLAESSALQGLTTILHQFKGEMFFGGRTYIDMLLLPVPRSIWPSKPDWYGISDITRLEGEPPSTQSAVTMPGEAYANFGWLGLPLMFGFGLIFRLLERMRLSPRTFFVYAFWMPTAISITFWMAFTGLMGQLVVLPLLLVLAAPAFRSRARDARLAVRLKQLEEPQRLIPSTSIAVRDI